MEKITDLCDIQYGYAFDSNCFTEDSSYPQLVRIRDVKRGYSETYYYGEYPDEYVLSNGDLLIGMDGEFNIARWKVEGALLNQRVCKVIAKEGTNEEYIRFFLSKCLKKIEERTSFATVKEAFSEYLDANVLDSRQIYFVNQIVEYIVHNGLMKDFSVLKEAPFTDQGSIVDIFEDVTVWAGIRKVINSINDNAVIS